MLTAPPRSARAKANDAGRALAAAANRQASADFVRIVLDTNMIVSGLISETGPPTRIVELCIGGDLQLVLDTRIEFEYRAVLARPALGVSAADAADSAEVLALLDYAERVIAAPLPFRLSDAADEPFLEAAVAGGVDALVTGNLRHFRIPGGRLAIPIVSPRRCVEMLGAPGG